MKKNVCQWIWQWFKLPKLSQGEIGNLNSLISIKEIEFVVKTSYKENLESEGFTGEFFQT